MPNNYDDEHPIIVDKRAGSGSKPKPVRGGTGPGHDPILDQPTDYSKNPNRLANVRWKRGEDPRDDLAVGHVGAHELSPEEAAAAQGYVDYKIEVLEHPESEGLDPFEGVTGSDSGVECWRCHSRDYLIISERSGADIGASQPDVAWAISQNRQVDPLKVPDVQMLFCPTCKDRMQLRKEHVLEFAAQQRIARRQP